MLPLKMFPNNEPFRYRFPGRKSVSFFGTEIGAVFRHGNRCRQAVPKSVSCFGTSGLEIDAKMVSPCDTTISVFLQSAWSVVRVQAPPRVQSPHNLKMYCSRCRTAWCIYEVVTRKINADEWKRHVAPLANLGVGGSSDYLTFILYTGLEGVADGWLVSTYTYSDGCWSKSCQKGPRMGAKHIDAATTRRCSAVSLGDVTPTLPWQWLWPSLSPLPSPLQQRASRAPLPGSRR